MWGAPTWPPTPPNVQSAPAKPGRSSIWLLVSSCWRSLLPLLHAVAGRLEAAPDRCDLLGAGCLQRQLDLRLADRRVRGERAVVEDLQDVGALLRDHCGEPRQRAGNVAQEDAETDEATVLHEAALDDAGEHRDVDVTAREDQRH